MNTNFSEIFQAAVQSEGASYRKVRDILVNTPNFESELNQVLRSGGEWNRIWVGRIVLGWRKNAAIFDKSAELIKGHLKGPKPITGKFSVIDRAKAIAALGNDVIPRLIEIVWKTKEYSDDSEVGAIFSAIRQLNNIDTAAPLRMLLDPLTPSNYRHSAITTLGHLQDTQAIFEIIRILQDPSENERIRIAALYAYAQFDTFEMNHKYRIFSSILTNGDNPEELRINAAEILSERDDPDTRELFYHLINITAEGELLHALVDGLRNHGNEESIPILKNLLEKTVDEDFQQLLRETIDTIENR